MEKRNYELEIFDIIKNEDWDKAKGSNDENLYSYVRRHKDDENCKIIWKHIKTETRDFESEVLEIIETKDWDRAKASNDRNLYDYIRCHRGTDENCKIIWDHISIRKDYKSEISEIIETEDWDRARGSNDKNLYQYIHNHKDTDKNCKTIWEHIIKKHCPYTTKDYLLNYFKHGKLENRSLCNWFSREINKGNQCCIDIKNLIVAANTYQDPVALETLGLIKNHLEKEGV
jgi:hypothetical protein